MPDAADGRRAVILARGFAPLDELPASEAEWRRAATLLTTLWRLAGVETRSVWRCYRADAHPDGRALIVRALGLEGSDGIV